MELKLYQKDLNMRKKHIYYLYSKSDNVVKADPFEVGSGKSNYNIFKYVKNN